MAGLNCLTTLVGIHYYTSHPLSGPRIEPDIHDGASTAGACTTTTTTTTTTTYAAAALTSTCTSIPSYNYCMNPLPQIKEMVHYK